MSLTSGQFRARSSAEASSPHAPRAEAPTIKRWGAELTPQGVTYSIWAPEHARVVVVVRPANASRERSIPLTQSEDGFHRATDPEGHAGDAYHYLIDGKLLPDPASRAQSTTVHFASLVVDSRSFHWSDSAWRRPAFRDLVIYELHVGTFTPEGTFRAVISKLPHLRDLGVNAIELMPVADFPGERSWGYDGVLVYAPARAYGSPDDMRALIDAAHAEGIAVILDVVYNHFGPDGNYLWQFTGHFFNTDRQTPWGASINFDGESSGPVRSFFVQNIVYWMEEFHIDGFRLDATHAIRDESPRHVLQEITATIHARGGYAIAEDSRNEARMLESPADGGLGFDAVWADDFHHILRVSQTDDREGYFRDFEGTLEEMLQTLDHGWLYRGQTSESGGKTRGTPCRHLPPTAFLHCLSNHDQTGNRAFGQRLGEFVSPEAYRAFALLLCLTPYTPMLFMGQEWHASTPFLYFTDHGPELGQAITEGRRREFAEFSEFKNPATLASIPDPQAQQTFVRSKLDWSEKDQAAHAQICALYAEALRMRARDPLFRPRDRDTWRVGRLSFGVGAIRFDGHQHSYLLLFNIQGGNSGNLTAEKIAVLPAGEKWDLVLWSEEARFGGSGIRPFDPESGMCNFPTVQSILLRAEHGHYHHGGRGSRTCGPP